MKKFKNKKGLVLEHMDEDNKKNNNVIILDSNSNETDKEKSKIIIANYSDSMSIEIGKEGVVFKKDDLAVEKEGVKKITTGKYISMIDPKKLEVNFPINLDSRLYWQRSKRVCPQGFIQTYR